MVQVGGGKGGQKGMGWGEGAPCKAALPEAQTGLLQQGAAVFQDAGQSFKVQVLVGQNLLPELRQIGEVWQADLTVQSCPRPIRLQHKIPIRAPMSFP